jgi:mannose-6-phosphate isomerase-like protein (cupin superfamily)
MERCLAGRSDPEAEVVRGYCASVRSALTAGDVLFIPAGTIHAARNVGPGRAAELATYIVEKGKPLLTVVE